MIQRNAMQCAKRLRLSPYFVIKENLNAMRLRRSIFCKGKRDDRMQCNAMRNATGAASIFWIHLMQRVTLHHPPGREGWNLE